MTVHDVNRVREIVGELQRFDRLDPRLLETLQGFCHRDVRWDTQFAMVDGEVFRGADGVARFFRQWLAAWTDWTWTVEDLFDTPTGVVLRVREHGKSRSGVEVEQRHVQEWVLRHGRLSRWTVFMDKPCPPRSVR
jgi:ketosteroid isomerase-like protein